MDIESLKKEAQKLQKIAKEFMNELAETGAQEGYLEIITVKVPDLLSKIVEGLEDLAEKINKLEGTPVGEKMSFIMRLRKNFGSICKKICLIRSKKVRELSKSGEK